MKNEKVNRFFKMVIIFICYLCYVTVFDKMFSIFNIKTGILTMFLSDILFLILIVFLYRKNLKEDYDRYNANYPLKRKLITIIKWVLILFAINIIMGIATEIFLPNISNGNDENTISLLELFNTSYFYTLFKTLIFASIAEELLFKEVIRDIVKNNILFVLVSSIIYTGMNFVYSDLEFNYIIIDMLGYFLFGVISSIAYIKNYDNIIISILIKFFYNIIPTILMILAVLI